MDRRVVARLTCRRSRWSLLPFARSEASLRSASRLAVSPLARSEASVRSASRLALIILIVTVGVATLAGPATAESVDVEHTVGTTDEAGTVDVTTRVVVPSGTASLRMTIPRDADVYEKRGFTRVDARTYEWTRSTDEPSLSYTMAGNVTVDRGDGDRHLFAVTDTWAIVRSPTVDVRTASGDVEADERYRVDGQGAAGPDVTYLGAHATHVRAADQRFTLVVPDAADMATTPAAALDSLEEASRRIEFGRRDDEVFVVVAPTTVEWAATGLQRGDADMWIRDVQRVDTVRNAWIHEYVHTRQDYEPTAETRWTVEAMAEYYAALVPFEAGRISYGAFRSKLDDGRSAAYDDVVLAEPSTWEPDEGDYVKGALVWATLDGRLHADADASMGDVVAAFGDREVSRTDFLDAVETVGGTELRAEAREYTETTATPEVRSRTEHVRAFGGPLVRHEFDAFAVSGPVRETDVAAPRLVTGETLEATVVVRNEGTDPGEYWVPFRVDGRTVATRAGTLGPGESATLSFTRRFRTAGEYDLRAGTATATAVVRRPAEPTVTELTAEPARPARGEPVRIMATVGSSAERPAIGTITIAVDGDALATRRVAVDDVATVEATTSFDAAGEHTVGAGDRTASVTVREVTLTPTPGPWPGDGSSGVGAGFSVPIAVAALAGVALLLGGRSS